MMGLLILWFERQTRGMVAGIAAAGGSVAIILTALVVPWLIDQSPADGWRHTWYFFGGLVLGIGVLALVFLRDRPGDNGRSLESAHDRRATRGPWPMAVFKQPAVWLMASLAFCSGTASGVFGTFFGAYLTDENSIELATAGQLLMLVGILSVGCGILWGTVSDRLGRSRSFGLSFLIQGVGFTLFWLTSSLTAFVVASALLGLTMRAAYTLCAAGAGDHVSAQFAATAFATMSVCAGLGSTISPIISGIIADNIGISWVFALAMAASFTGAVVSLLLPAPRASQLLTGGQSSG